MYRIFKVTILILGLLFGLHSFGQNAESEFDRVKITAGKTVGSLPFLKYGPGIDRLGGAKMTYLDTAVVMQVVDSVKDDYIVQLSKNHRAFIPKENVQFIPGYCKPDYYLTSSWNVSGNDKYDFVTIALDERLPYKSIQMTDPSRIVVDIYGATGNTNWITQLKSAKEIKKVSHEQLEDDIFRINIDLKHSQQWGYSINYKKKALVIAVKHQPESLSLRNLNIAIDAGHGGSNSGATGVKSGTKEKNVNLSIAKELEKYLTRKGAKVFMTRSTDIDLSMVDRTLMLREANPDLLISIHHNAGGNPNVKGVSTYYRYLGSKELSVNILNRTLELGLADFGNIGSFNFALNGPTEYPNCLVEVAFMSNEEDEKRINNPTFQKQVAKKIRKGVIDWIRDIK